MREDKDHIDDFFKERSEQHSFEVPDSFLEDINNKLDALEKKKKRRTGFWWLSLIPIAMILTYVLWPGEKPTTKNQYSSAGKKDTAITEKIDQSRPDAKESQESNSIEKEVLETDLSIHRTGKESEEKESLFSYLKKDNIVLDTIGDNGPLWLKEKDKQEATEDQNAKDREETSASEKIDSEKIDPEGTLSENDTEDNKTSEAIDDLASKEKENQTDVAEIKEKESGDTSRVENTDTESEISSINVSDSSSVETTAEKAVVDSVSTSTQDADTSDTKKIKDEPDTKKKRTHEIQLYSGMMNSIANVSAGTDPAVLSMKSMESDFWSIPIGAMYRAQINSIDLGLGISWTKTGENVNYKTNSLTYYDVDSLVFTGWQIDSLFDQNQGVWTVDSIPLYDSLSVTVGQLDSVSFTGKNQYSWITVPLRFGYRINVKSFTIIPRVGIDLNFAMGTNTGTYAELADQGLVQLASNRFTLSYAVQLEIRREFGKMHVFANPYFRSDILSVISSAAQERKYHSWGFNLGCGFTIK